MDDCEQFKDGDYGVMDEYLGAFGVFKEPIVIKFYTGTTSGDPTQGIAKTFTYTEMPYTAVITHVEQKDLVMAGGIYQLGDITIQLDKELKEIDDKTGSPGDRVIWRNHEYRPVGRISASYIGGYVLFTYLFRRV